MLDKFLDSKLLGQACITFMALADIAGDSYVSASPPNPLAVENYCSIITDVTDNGSVFHMLTV